jgi:hypothetical protein
MGDILWATAIQGVKVGRPSTKKQIKLLERLSRGYSAKDTAKAAKLSSAKEKSHILYNHNFIYKEENPCLCLID